MTRDKKMEKEVIDREDIPGHAHLHRRKTPSTPDTPIPSTMSRVSLKGTSSGVVRREPCGSDDGEERRGEERRGEVEPERGRMRCGPVGHEKGGRTGL